MLSLPVSSSPPRQRAVAARQWWRLAQPCPDDAALCSCTAKPSAAAALSSLTPPLRCQEIVHESKLAQISFLSRGRFFGTNRAPAMKSYQKIVRYLLLTVFFVTDWALPTTIRYYKYARVGTYHTKIGVLVSWRYVGYLQSYTFCGQKKLGRVHS